MIITVTSSAMKTVAATAMVMISHKGMDSLSISDGNCVMKAGDTGVLVTSFPVSGVIEGDGCGDDCGTIVLMYGVSTRVLVATGIGQGYPAVIEKHYQS